MSTTPPAWAHLQPQSLKALLTPPERRPQALRLTPDRVSVEAALRVPIVAAARLLMERAAAQGGFRLTPAGFLKRADVRPVFDQTDWPGIDKAAVLAANKVINEEDAYGVFFTRIVLQSAGLLRRRLGVLRVSKTGQSLLAPEAAPALLALLFEATFWKTNLQDFDRVPLEFWPQHHMGVVLWSLSVAAYGWSSGEALMQASTIMQTLDDGTAPDLPEFAFVVRALRPLAWLGLIELKDDDGDARPPTSPGFREYRKAPLFDELLSFKVDMMGAEEARH